MRLKIKIQIAVLSLLLPGIATLSPAAEEGLKKESEMLGIVLRDHVRAHQQRDHRPGPQGF